MNDSKSCLFFIFLLFLSSSSLLADDLRSCDIDYVDTGASQGVLDDEDSQKFRDLLLFKVDESEFAEKFLDWNGDGDISTHDLVLFTRYRLGKITEDDVTGCDCFTAVNYPKGHSCNPIQWSRWEDILIYGPGDKIETQHLSKFQRTTPEKYCEYRVRVFKNASVSYFPDTRRIYTNTSKDGFDYSKYYVEFDIQNSKNPQAELAFDELVDINDSTLSLTNNCRNITRGERFYVNFFYEGHDSAKIQKEHFLALLTNPLGKIGGRFDNFCYLFNDPSDPIITYPQEMGSLAEKMKVHPKNSVEIKVQQRCLE
ncbi:MAG: hypothetical protein H6621_10170 [Halobacteriovoraceae bacterium]|nr:hypothetical protein [Halobacteriovoraceae bacterium]MCB9095422.1 hypothetical protein [Halobacteriovoraceae bacterium]